jgi:hypothetical protein
MKKYLSIRYLPLLTLPNHTWAGIEMQEQAFGHYVSELLERFILIAQQEVDFVLHTRQQLHTHLL